MLLPYIWFVFCMSEVISSFRSLRAGSQVFALLFFELEDCVMINRQKHYTKYLHDKLETKDIRCI